MNGNLNRELYDRLDLQWIWPAALSPVPGADAPFARVLQPARNRSHFGAFRSDGSVREWGSTHAWAYIRVSVCVSEASCGRNSRSPNPFPARRLAVIFMSSGAQCGPGAGRNLASRKQKGRKSATGGRNLDREAWPCGKKTLLTASYQPVLLRSSVRERANRRDPIVTLGRPHADNVHKATRGHSRETGWVPRSIQRCTGRL